MAAQTDSDHAVDSAPPSDGRRRRREQGRLAVVDAVIDLLLDGHRPPGAEDIAMRAGTSVASVFRYFATLDELRQAGIQRFLERIDHLVAVSDIGEGDLGRRINGLVSARLAYYAQAAPIARLARQRAVEVPELAITLQRVRATLSDQLDQHFHAELKGLSRATRRHTVAALATLTSFESWDQLVATGFSRQAIASTWRRAIAMLLTGEVA